MRSFGTKGETTCNKPSSCGLNIVEQPLIEILGVEHRDCECRGSGDRAPPADPVVTPVGRRKPTGNEKLVAAARRIRPDDVGDLGLIPSGAAAKPRTMFSRMTWFCVCSASRLYWIDLNA